MIKRRSFIQFIMSAVVAKSLLAKTVSVMAGPIERGKTAVLKVVDPVGYSVGDKIRFFTDDKVSPVFSVVSVGDNNTSLTILSA